MTRSVYAGAVFALFCASVAFPQDVFTFTSFDPPRSTETHAYSVNNAGTVVGYYLDSSSGLYEGYERTKAGKFSKPITQPGTTIYLTGLNDSGVIAGYSYPPAPANEVTFTLFQGVYTDFAYNGNVTQIDRINNAGDLAGIYVESSTRYPGFLYSAATGTTTSFSVPGAAATFAEGLNKNDVIVGAYTTIPYSTYGAFMRSAAGRITKFSYPGAAQTYGEQINDCNVIVGTFTDSAGVLHGFYGKLNNFTQIDYPGAALTAIDGINNHGEMVGSYFDSAGVRHGMIATPATPSCSP